MQKKLLIKNTIIDIAPVSLMPEGLEMALTVQEFLDLIAWMETLK